MEYKKHVEAMSEKLVRAHIEAFNTLSIDPIIDAIHPEIKYLIHGKFGIHTELRYLGFLYKAFYKIKQDGKTVVAEFIWVEDGTYKFPAIKLLPPTDTRILTHDEYNHLKQLTYSSIENEVILYLRIKENRIFKILLGDKKSIKEGKFVFELDKPTLTYIVVDTGNDRGKSAKVTPKTSASGHEYVVFDYLPQDQQIAWRKIIGFPISSMSLEGDRFTPHYADYIAFYEWWTKGTPVNRWWFLGD